MAEEAQSRLDGRIEKIKQRIAARTGPDRKPRPGFADNVRALQSELTRLETIKAEQADNG